MHGGKVLFGLSEHQLNGAMAMSEESTSTEPEADLAAVEDTKASEAAQLAAEQAKLGKKFRIIAGEEILLTKRPSTFAFLNLYLLGLLVLAIHAMFEIRPGTESENFIVDLLATTLFTSDTFGLTAVMLFITWMNRLMLSLIHISEPTRPY